MDFKIREIRTVAQGPKKLPRARETYSQLVQQGFSNKRRAGSSASTRRPGDDGGTAAALTAGRRRHHRSTR